jgi:xylulokinase
VTGTPPYLIGADAGTSGCKVTLIDSAGHVLAGSQAGYKTNFPRPGWAEQDPEDWHRALVQAVRQCIETADVPARDVAALSVCGPAHNVVLLDRDRCALQPVIHWSDLRSTPQAAWLEAEHGSTIYEITYQRVNPVWTLPQLLWVRQNQPEVWQRIHRVVIGKDYLSYRLTGSWRTDWYDAMGTQMFDARAREWSQPICELLGLPLDRLPPVSDATEITGKVTAAAAQETGLATGTPVAVGSGDSVVEALGAGVVEPGQCIVKLGTAGNVNVVTAEPRPDRRTLTYCHVVPDRWYTIAATNSGASSAKWFREAFNLKARSPGAGGRFLVDRMAAEVPPGSEGLIFHPYLQGERSPYWDPALRGDFIGITIRHQQQHFARAVLEGVAFSLRDCVELVRDLGISITETRLMGGGACSALWRQIVANVLGMDLLVSAEGTTAYGAALLAGVASGVFSDVQEAAMSAIHTQGNVQSDPKNAARYAQLYPLYRQATQSLGPIYHALREFKE